jgi:hypothetical protein
MPGRTMPTLAWCIRVSVMLECIVKAQPVHAFKHLGILLLYWMSARFAVCYGAHASFKHNSYYVDLSVTSERQNKFIPMSLPKINNLRSRLST